jgi:hypothetical protein
LTQGNPTTRNLIFLKNTRYPYFQAAMYDNICKFIAENFKDDLATWLLGSPIKLTELSPTELSS